MVRAADDLKKSLAALSGHGITVNATGSSVMWRDSPLRLPAAQGDAHRPVVAVLLDAALVRLILLPVLLRLTGRAAWHTPAWLKRVLPDIPFSHE
ncbi:hypothetical protein ACFYO2_38180 [Streptomyces sp. NPDC006602]|uniref:hypothetical protein n=1 Tax=Streptomyces sp. NPDC006602 TaxID=3364751 RepID=UPI00367B9C34